MKRLTFVIVIALLSHALSADDLDATPPALTSDDSQYIEEQPPVLKEEIITDVKIPSEQTPTAPPDLDTPSFEQPVEKQAGSPNNLQQELAPEDEFSLVEVFSVEKNPGVGQLKFSSGKQAQTYQLGSQTGLYAMGMVFKGNDLPASFQKQLAGKSIIQVALGTGRSKLKGQLPQFGALTLIGNGLSSDKTEYPIFNPKMSQRRPVNYSFLLFTPPSTPNSRTDEDKLRTTFLAETGRLVVNEKGGEKIVDVNFDGAQLKFQMHLAVMSLSAELGSPFNPAKSTFTGDIQFPIYSPHNGAAQAFIRRVAAESLQSTMGLVPARQVTSKPKSPKKQ